MYQCVHVRKEEERGGSREKEKGTESKHGGGVEERERKLWIEIERREREGEWMVVERGRSGGKAEFAKKGDGERGWRKDGKSEVGRATRRLEGGEREREGRGEACFQFPPVAPSKPEPGWGDSQEWWW